MSEKKTPKLTFTNLYALSEAIKAAPDGVIERISSGAAHHLQRCLDAGLLESAGKPKAWKLSAAGIEALSRGRERLSGNAGPAHVSRSLRRPPHYPRAEQAACCGARQEEHRELEPRTSLKSDS